MTLMDPTEIFRQEASELLETLEGALLDLGQRPDDRELVDSAFRALHTIKGSGAMFGFDKVASFTHEFETAFDLVRKGEIKPTQDLISVALAAKDYIRALIETPDATDSIIGDAILGDLKQFVSRPAEADSAVAAPAARERGSLGWQLRLEFDQHILCNGSNPLDFLDDLCKLGPCFVVPLTDDVPNIDELEPEYCFLKWDVTLHSSCDKAAIDDVFMFVQDEMKLTLTPLAEGALPPTLPMLDLDAPLSPLETSLAEFVSAEPALQVAPAEVASAPSSAPEPVAK
jgi:two-component system, chemotaxis family, sensor kinase CheA